MSILAAPMRTPRGEIVGVVEILNKRRRNFTKEDEEFLAEVGTHAALAVESVREHERAVRKARREGAADVLKRRLAAAAARLLARHSGLRVGAAAMEVGGAQPGALCRRGRARVLAFLLLEDRREIEDSVGALVRASRASARARLPTATAAESSAAAGKRTRAARSRRRAGTENAPRWRPARRRCRVSSASGAPFPSRSASPPESAKPRSRPPGEICSFWGLAGLVRLVSGGRPPSAEKAVQKLARAAETQPLSAAFAGLVSEWKKAGVAPGPRDVLLLAAKRL